MNRTRRVGASLAVLVAALSGAVLSPTPSAARTRGQVAATDVQVEVVSISPSTPAITSVERPLVVTVRLENMTGKILSGVSLAAQRGDPLGSQAALDASLASTSARSGGLAIEPVTPTTVTLPPATPVIATFRTTTSLLADTGRICLCHNEIYPIDLTARTADNGSGTVLGGVRTYLPSFDDQPTAKLGVTWIWPLIDRPHRTADGSVFTDDALAASVAGGRLDRALAVVEGVAPTVPLTLVIDPDLLDELQIMSTGAYTVRTAGGTVTRGTGQQAATAWLVRLRTVLANPNVDFELTPLADPDVTGLSEHGKAWSGTLSAGITASVTAALGGRAPQHTLAWPPTGSATTDVLDRLVTGGANTVVLDGSRVRPSTTDGIPVSSTRVRTSTGTVAALLTSPALQASAQSALAGARGALPLLLSELAVRVAQRPGVQQTATIAAPRYVDPVPATAIPVILSTVQSVFSAPVGADAALEGSFAPTTKSTLRAPVTVASGLTDGQLDRISAVRNLVPSVTSLIGGSAAGRQVLSAVPDTLQRTESAAWSRAGTDIGGGPVPGTARADTLRTQLSGYLRRVRILPPVSGGGSYTLASGDSPLPISVRNDNSLSVRVQLSVKPVGGLPGFSATDITKQLGPNSKITVKVPTRIQRSGRIPVQAELRTPNDYVLGGTVQLFVHSTVLGTIGVVITIVAGVVLALALLVRYVRRVLRVRGKRGPTGTTGPRSPAPDREPAV